MPRLGRATSEDLNLKGKMSIWNQSQLQTKYKEYTVSAGESIPSLCRHMGADTKW